MGLWNWMTTRLAGPESGHDEARASVRRTACPGAAATSPSGATALLEEPCPTDAEESWWAPQPGDLHELPEPQRPDLSPENRALENLLIMHFDGRNLSLPSLPQVPERVLRMLANPDRGLSQVAAEIGKDPVTAAAVIRMSNSSLYCGLAKITSIQAAVVRLGANVVRTLMYNLSVRSVMFTECRKGSQLAEMLWRRALAGGIVMRSLSSFTKMNAEEAFLLGLLQDVGNIIVLRIVNSQRAVMKSDIDLHCFEYLCREAHQEFGELLADAWGLPDRLKSLISNHHGQPSLNDPYRAERLQMQMAEMICALLDYMPYAPVQLLESRPAHDLGLAGRPDFLAFLATFPADVDAAIAELS